MKLKGITLNNVEIGLIIPIYIESVSESSVRKRINLLSNGEQLSSFPVVERDKDEEKYWLVSGFLEYLAYSQYATVKKQTTLVPVIEQEYTSVTNQRIKLLRKMFQDQSNWLDRHYLINELLDKNLSIKEISDKIGVSTADIENYLIHHELPPEIVKRAYRNKGSFPNLEKIRRLSLHPFLKYRLYRRAVLPIRDYDRLTTDKLQKILWLISIDEFRMLTWREQWEMIEQVFTFKDMLMKKWEKECLDKLKLNGRIFTTGLNSSISGITIN